MKRGMVSCLMLGLIALTGPAAPAAEKEPIPAPAVVVVNKAEKLLAAGKTREAIDALEAFQAKGRDVSQKTADSRGYTHYLVDFLLGNGYLTLENPETAVKHFRAAVAKKPDFFEARFNLARALYDLNRPAEAGQAFAAAYETSGNRKADALYYAAVCFMRAEDYPRALKIFDRLLAEHPQELSLDWRQTLARLYLAMEDPARALPHIELLAGQLEGKSQREWREILIYAYLQLDMNDKALARVTAFTRDDPLEARWWKIQAWLLLQRQDYRRALTSLTAYSYLQAPSGRERELLGDVNLMAGIPLEAVRNYEKQLDAAPDPDLFKKTARGYLRLYDQDRALALIERGLETAPDDQDLLSMKGYLLYEAGRLDEAAAVYERLSTLAPESGDHWMMRGYIAWQQGDIAAARRAFTRAAEFKPCAGRAQKALERLK